MKRGLKAAFHYCSQLQTWSKTWSQAGRKHVESQLRTCLKRFFSTFHLSSTRTNQRTCCGLGPGSRQKKSKAGRKRVANPHELVENLAANLVENQLCRWLKNLVRSLAVMRCPCVCVSICVSVCHVRTFCQNG